jgi:hypothetical protein
MARPAWWLLAARLLAGLVWRGLVFLARLVVFVAEPVDEFVTAWLGIAPVGPQLRGWRGWWRQLRARWRDHRNGVIQGEVMEGVWR